jgi:hypothetical protein
MLPFMLPREHFDVLVAVAFRGPRYERGGRTDRWQRPTWLARPKTSPDEIGWLLVRENVAALFTQYPLADWTEMPGAAPDWTCHRNGKIIYEFSDPGYQLSAVEGIKALATFEAVAAEAPRYSTSHARRFCTSLRDALLPVVPGMELAPAIWYRARLRAAVADVGESTPSVPA